MKTFKQFLKENQDNHYSLLQNKIFAFNLPLFAFGKDESSIVSRGEDDYPRDYIKNDICIEHNNKNFCFIISGHPKVIIKITDSSKLLEINLDTKNWEENLSYVPAYDIIDVEIKKPDFLGHILPVGDIVDINMTDGDENQANMLRNYIKAQGLHYVIENILEGFKLIKNGWFNETTPSNPKTDAAINMAYSITRIINNNIILNVKTKVE